MVALMSLLLPTLIITLMMDRKMRTLVFKMIVILIVAIAITKRRNILIRSLELIDSKTRHTSINPCH